MRSGPSVCSVCSKNNTGKWKAQRHNMIVHMNQGQVYDRLNNLIPDLILLSTEDTSDPKETIGDFQTNVRDPNNNNMIHYPFTIKKTNKTNFGSEGEIIDENENVDKKGAT